MKPPRGLSAEEAALWRRVAETVTPLEGRKLLVARPSPIPPAGGAGDGPTPDRAPFPDKPTPNPSRKREGDLSRRTLDGSWDRRLAHGLVAPDAQLDLHGLGIDAAYTRLMASLAQAHFTGARVLLVIAGKSRPHGDHDQRGNRRGAIRAKLLDWLAASPHASKIAAIRPAHQRHGGAGAVYVVLRRPR
ncbi:MAG: Smr/MutS family protein [Novosphingobium sp.]|nr:Smr/MutS family protein [Novosphingobium sp.]